MNYIGSKHKLSDFIQTTVHSVCGEDLSQKVCCDLFAGTGVVGQAFKPKVKTVIANDLEYYSYVLNRAQLCEVFGKEEHLLCQELDALQGVTGFVSKNYGEYGKENRLYFSQENAEKIDAMRTTIENWKEVSKISEGQYFSLLATLLKAADKVANTASVYGAFLKNIKPSARRTLQLVKQAPPTHSLKKEATQHLVFNLDANELIKKIEGDILYLDPPYNARQYGANYHLLNTIAKYNIFTPRGKTGLPDYNKSAYCSKRTVAESLDELIKNAQFKHVFLSYNNEGLLPQDTVRTILEHYGRYNLVTTKYQRFKADKTENRNHKATSTTEQLHILEKR